MVVYWENGRLLLPFEKMTKEKIPAEWALLKSWKAFLKSCPPSVHVGMVDPVFQEHKQLRCAPHALVIS